MNEKELQEYITRDVDRIVRDAMRATLKDPRQSAFFARFAIASARANRLREREEQEGLHVPTFLIASVTSSCNLHCAGCYSRANHATVDCAPQAQLTDGEWREIFSQAEELGVSFILLAGGEPMLRRGVMEAAGEKQSILFPIFTNGTYMDEKYLALFERCRNLIPVFSIEGDRAVTDARRGEGVYDKLMANMEAFHKRGLIFGASVTVTAENLKDALSEPFLRSLREMGCRVAFFIEFVPVTEEARRLAPGDAEREYLKSEIDRLRAEHPDMLYLAFPGDEKITGGCLAAGRGFFHINSHGGAEPCPFSPYSDINVKDTSLREAISSRLFAGIRDKGLLEEEHAGGCTLFERREEVEQTLSESKR